MHPWPNWIRHWSTKPGITGSNPVGCANFSSINQPLSFLNPQIGRSFCDSDSKIARFRRSASIFSLIHFAHCGQVVAALFTQPELIYAMLRRCCVDPTDVESARTWLDHQDPEADADAISRIARQGQNKPRDTRVETQPRRCRIPPF